MMGEEVIPWQVASKECLDVAKAYNRSIDYDTMHSICRNIDNINLTAMSSFLQSDEAAMVVGGRLSYPEFFEGDDWSVTWKTTVQASNGTAIYCYNEPEACAAALDTFVGANAGRARTVCKEWKSNIRFLSMWDQEFARINLCNNPGMIESCEPLTTQMAEIEKKWPEARCIQYGFSAGDHRAAESSTCKYELNATQGSGSSAVRSPSIGICSALFVITGLTWLTFIIV
jgi:hypothetical protein